MLKLFLWLAFHCFCYYLSLSLVAKSCSTLATPWTVACQAPVHRILQARILEWVAIYFSRDLPNPGIEPGSPVLLLLLSRFSRVRLCATPWRQPTRLHHPWDSSGKNTGVGCHCLLQCMKVKSESEVAQSCPTLCDPMDCSLSGSSIHGTSRARVLEWSAIALSLEVTRKSTKNIINTLVLSAEFYFY